MQNKISKWSVLVVVLAGLLATTSCQQENKSPREIVDFNFDWKFQLGDDSLAFQPTYDDSQWRSLRLPHDWSIEGEFSEENDTRQAGGALPAGKGWYRKHFTPDANDAQRQIAIEFGGVYRNSEVWINGQWLGKRPFGYITFRYDLTPYLKFGEENIIAVKVDNTPQPNSRWYTGSGIYRDVKLIKTNPVHVAQWGTFITTTEVSDESAVVNVAVVLDGKDADNATGMIETIIYDAQGAAVGEKILNEIDWEKSSYLASAKILQPNLWSIETPNLYKAVTKVYVAGLLTDEYTTAFGIRTYHFDPLKGFTLNGEPIKIHGVNQHHDLGALGAAFNVNAEIRRLKILKEMGVNAIRMAHNPPAQPLLDLCDQMGFLVIDESFDEWKVKKAKKGYHLDWDEWHVQDQTDAILRDRNHPSIIIWSIGNEIREQFDSTGLTITKELAEIVRGLDTTRYITSGLTENEPDKNFITQSGALDLYGFNYKHEAYEDLPNRFPGIPLLASETSSAFATRGHYDMPSDSIQRWPAKYKDPIPNANPDYTISAYDMISAYWGSTHEETWKVVKRLDHMAGIFVWSGFDYIGEPDPYPYPARSAYLGIIDLAGFPKDAYYLYQSEWSKEPMLHVFPHWNWQEGQTVDVWAYYNDADEVELFLNGTSQGIRKKQGEDLHVFWRLTYAPGEIKVVARKDGAVTLERTIFTAGDAAKVQLTADKTTLKADTYDMAFVTVDITDESGILAPNADNLVQFETTGPIEIVGVDNGYQASMESFKAPQRKAWKGKCLVMLRTTKESGVATITAKSAGIEGATINFEVK